MKKYIVAVIVVCIIAIIALRFIHIKIVANKSTPATPATVKSITPAKTKTVTKETKSLITINSKAEFNTKILKADKVVLVDFHAVWCPPCRKLGPIIEKIAAESNGKYFVAKIDIDKNKELAHKYGIVSIPTVIIFKDGKPVKKIVGYNSEKVYTDAIDAVSSK